MSSLNFALTYAEEVSVIQNYADNTYSGDPDNKEFVLGRLHEDEDLWELARISNKFGIDLVNYVLNIKDITKSIILSNECSF